MAKGDVEDLRGPAVGSPSTSAIRSVPLPHKDSNKSMLTKAFHHVRDWKTAVKNGRAFAPYSYIERKTRQATRSTVAYGPLGGMLSTPLPCPQEAPRRPGRSHSRSSLARSLVPQAS